MAGQRGQFAAVGGLVQREQDQGQARVRTEPIQQRLQRPDVIRPGRDIAALVAAEAVKDRRRVIAEAAGVKLHHQTVLDRHGGHLGQHLAAEQFSVGGARRGGRNPLEQGFGVRLGQIGGEGGRVAVVRRGGAHLDEKGPAITQRLQIALPGHRIATRLLRQNLEVVAEALVVGVQHRVRAIGGQHPPLPARGVYDLVVLQRVERALGRGQDLDVVAVEQGPRLEGLGLQRGVDDVIVVVRRLGRQADVDAEGLGIDPVVPHARRRAPEQMIVLGEAPPDLAWVRLDRAAVGPRHPQVLHRHPLRVQHAEDVVVGRDQQLGRVGEVFIAREPTGVGVTVRANDRQTLHFGVEASRHAAGVGVGREQTVGVQAKRLGHADTRSKKSGGRKRQSGQQ
ncbi:hypothetical protein D3C86_731760 [compost metagenome]